MGGGNDLELESLERRTERIESRGSGATESPDVIIHLLHPLSFLTSCFSSSLTILFIIALTFSSSLPSFFVSLSTLSMALSILSFDGRTSRFLSPTFFIAAAANAREHERLIVTTLEFYGRWVWTSICSLKIRAQTDDGSRIDAFRFGYLLHQDRMFSPLAFTIRSGDERRDTLRVCDCWFVGGGVDGTTARFGRDREGGDGFDVERWWEVADWWGGRVEVG